MLESYGRIGGDPARFWDLTPRLYLLEMLAYHQRERDADRGSTSRAWLTAVLSRAAEVPSLDELLHGRREYTAEEAIAKLRAMTGAPRLESASGD